MIVLLLIAADTLYLFQKDTLFLEQPYNRENIEEQNIHGTYSTGVYYIDGNSIIYHAIKLSGKEKAIGVKLDFNGQPSGLYRLDESDFFTLGIEVDRWAQFNVGLIKNNFTNNSINGIESKINLKNYTISGLYGKKKEKLAYKKFILQKGVYGPYRVENIEIYENIYINSKKLNKNNDYIFDRGEIWLSSGLNFKDHDTLTIVYKIETYDNDFVYGTNVNYNNGENFNLLFYKNNNAYIGSSNTEIGIFNYKMDFNKDKKIKGKGEIGLEGENMGISFLTSIDTTVNYNNIEGNISGIYGHFSFLSYGIFKKDSTYIHTAGYSSNLLHFNINMGDKTDMFCNFNKGIFNFSLNLRDNFQYNNVEVILQKNNKRIKTFVVQDSNFTEGLSLDYKNLYLSLVNYNKNINGEIKYSFNKKPLYSEFFIFKKTGFKAENSGETTEWIGTHLTNSLNTNYFSMNSDMDFRKNEETIVWNTFSYITAYPEQGWIITGTFNRADSLEEKRLNITTQITKTIKHDLSIYNKDYSSYIERGIGISPTFFYFITFSPTIEIMKVEENYLYFNRGRFTGNFLWQHNENYISYRFTIERDEGRTSKRPYLHNLALSIKVWKQSRIDLNWTEMIGSYRNRIINLSFGMNF